MEVRMQPLTDANQRCLSFELSVKPRTRVFSYTDCLGNTVHHFNIPGRHSQLSTIADSLVEVLPAPPLPEQLEPAAWDELDRLIERQDYWEMLVPSHFARSTKPLLSLAGELGVERRADPLTLVREINTGIYRAFDYVPQSTSVDSPIDVGIDGRHGVCQDFAHIMIALLRIVRIPCRYISGYLYHTKDRSTESATHAWVEAMLPGLGWVGFDPTNNLICGNRHIRAAIGRDYADVPPNRGIFKGSAASELAVAVRVTPSGAPAREELRLPDIVPDPAQEKQQELFDQQILLQQQQQQQ
jgi:transglutaminase-like putative cysteine protease